jgi:hypothetical protein
MHSDAQPENYPIGSVESRAAARFLLESQSDKKEAIWVVFIAPDRTETSRMPLIIPAL